MNPKFLLVLGVVAGCAAQVVACSSDFSSCAERRSCIENGGGGAGGGTDVAGDAGDSPASAGKSGGAASGASGESGESGAGGEGGAVFETPTLFGACSGVGKLACDGAASAQRLACDGSKWQAGTTCPSGQLCNSEDGKCMPTIEECADAKPGQTVCRADVPLTCGPDLVTADLGEACANSCKDGVCQAPKCGDHKIQNDEACDDGNVLPGDGCSATCTVEPVALALGNGFSCALGSNGIVKCWGDNQYGQLGQGDTENRGDNSGELGAKLLPVSLGAKRIAKAISAGNDSVCALLDDHSVKCWGRNDVGQLGTADFNNRGDGPGEMSDNLKPINFGAGRTATSISINRYEACAVLDNGSLKCWGDNASGQLGQDNTNGYANPALVPPIDLGLGRTAKAVSTSAYDYTCSLLDNGLLKCWGNYSFGQLCFSPEVPSGSDWGGHAGEMSQLPGFGVAAGRSVKTIVTGERTICALLDNGSIKCWGENAYGEGGGAEGCSDPFDLNNYPFVDLGVGRSAKSMTMTHEHNCILLDTGGIRCIGQNGSGQLGIGSTQNQGRTFQDSPLVKDVPLDRPALQVAAGNQHTCAILDDGLVRCWGLNDSGELGVGDKLTRGNSGGLAGVKLTPVALTF